LNVSWDIGITGRKKREEGDRFYDFNASTRRESSHSTAGLPVVASTEEEFARVSNRESRIRF
jgi:hypothetical protein